MVKKLFDSKLNQTLIGLLLVSLPFERLLTLEISGYTLKFSYIFGLFLVVYFIVSLLFQKIRFRFRSEEIWLLLFVLLNYLTYFWSIDRKRTLIISSAILLVFLIFISVRRLVSKLNIELVENFLILVGVLASIFAIWQFAAGSVPSLEKFAYLRPQYQSGLFGFPRVQSTFLEPLYFANFLILPLLLLVKKLMSSRQVRDFIYLGLMALAFFLTLSRGAEYALIVALVILSLIIILKDRDRLKPYGLALLTIAAGVAVGSLLILGVAGKQGVKNYFGHATDTALVTNEGTVDRSSTSQVALGVFINNPQGIGSGAFGALPVYKDQISSKGYQIVNNEYLEILAETGAAGMFFFGLFLIGLLVYLIRRIRAGDKGSAFLLAASLAMLIQYLAFSTLYVVYIWVFLAVIWPAEEADERVSS